jgi:peptidoglycan hydrolase-like protein with peptidoglycan-binding domain
MDESNWYLRKAHDGSQFGPIPFSQLKQWAADAQVSPLDRVSTDDQTWIKAPMVPELGMDYLIEVSEDHYYGPTTVGAIREFLEAGEITAETRITNSKDATHLHVRDLLPPPAAADNGAPTSALLGRSSIRINLQQRIRELEEALLEERRARETAEMLVEKLEAQIARMTGR